MAMGEQVELRVPKKIVYVAIVVAIAAVCALAMLVSPFVAVWVLTVILFAYGLAQLLLPRGILPQVRSRFFDAGCCFILATGLAVFAQWANAAQII